MYFEFHQLHVNVYLIHVVLMYCWKMNFSGTSTNCLQSFRCQKFYHSYDVKWLPSTISYLTGVVKPKKSEKSWQALVVQVFKTMVVWRAVSKQTLLNLWKYLKFSHDYWKFVKILSALPETSVYGLWMTLHFSSLWRSGLFFWCPLRCVHCVVKNKVQLFWIHYI